MFAGGFDEGVVHGAYGGEVLLGDRFGCASAFGYVAVETAGEANVGIGIDEYFEVEEVTKLGVFK